MASLCSTLLAQAQDGMPDRSRQFFPGTISQVGDVPASRLRTRLERLPAMAKAQGLERLKRFHFTELDLESLDVDEEGALVYVDHFKFDPAVALAETDPPFAEATLPISPFPPGLIFHSRPGAPNVLFLNFAGENVVNTAWNTSLGRVSIPALAFSTDSDYARFSEAEQLAIKRIWQRVAEDYAPFNIDVTTERPAVFGTRTAHALITRSTDANGASNPSSSAGGVAYVDSFATSTYARYRPAWIYANAFSGSESLIAEAASHEIGHNMGLSHDGKTSGSEYYGGHGSGETSWGPIMGTGYNRNVSQWSRGEYYLANNTQDDLAIIAAKTSYRASDHGDTPQTATALVLSGTNIISTTPEKDAANANPANKGVLERNTDVDVFSFNTGNGFVRLAVNPWISPAGTSGGNLDVSIELRDASGTLIATNNPATSTAAEIQSLVPAGVYYLYVKNAGGGTPLTATPLGYTTYGSVGQYFISGSIAPVEASPVTVELVASANNESWGSVVPPSGAYAVGSGIQILATPATYYRFLRWTNGSSSTSNPLAVTMQTNTTMEAVFAELVTTNHSTPHWWLASYGYTNNFEAATGAIGSNGVPVWQSYLAGLNPVLATSQFRLTVSRHVSAVPVLTWNTTTGRVYTIWSSTNVAETFLRVPGASNLAATMNRFTNNAETSSLPSFYRIEVRKP